MRVLHIVEGETLAGADARATAEVLLATMVSQDPDVIIDELLLPAVAPAQPGPGPGARGRWGQGLRPAPRDDGAAALVESVLAADVIVLSVGAALGPGHPGRVGWMIGTLTRPDTLRVRAEVRRSGRRVSRRMVLVAPPASGARESRERAELVACVRAAFRSVDVGEFGVIAGGTAPATPELAGGPQRRALGSWWPRSRFPDRKAS